MSGASKGATQEAAAPEPAELHERITLSEAVRGQVTGRRMQICLINTGWGAKGYYGSAVLAEAARRKVFAAGTKMYLDHPSQTEQLDRPERSVRDLAAVLATDATYVDGALLAEAKVFAPFQGLLAEMRDHIGVSIRAAGQREFGEADGRSGLIVTSIDEARSVDFVTDAGRGGQVMSLLESAGAKLAEARNIGGWLESRLHLTFTQLTDDMYGDGRLNRDERIALSSAVGDALDAFVKRVEADQPQLYTRDLWQGPDDPATAAEMAESTHVPAPPAKPNTKGASMSGSTGQGAPPQGGATQLTEAEVLRTENTDLKAKLAEAQLQAAQLGDNARELTETKASLEEAKRENLRLRANDAARAKAITTLAESTLPETAHERVIESVTGDQVPLNDEGALDEAKLTEAIRGAIERERRYLARFAEEQGLGTVRGLGSSGNPDEISEADLTASLKDVFTTLGMPDTVADLAAKGR